jgi:hypothetical protein
VTLVVAILGSACSTNKLYEFEEGPNGSRIYRTTDGDTLRVESDGKTYGYPGNKRYGPGEHGVASKVGEEWDMSSFNVKPTPEGCEILFPLFHSDKANKQRYQSCWNRAWEIPALIVVLPVVLPFLIVGAVVLVAVTGIGQLFEKK